MTGNAVRIPPLAVEKFTEEQARLVGDWTHLVFSRVLVNSPRMYRTFVAHLEELIARTNLPPRDRQIVCLRMLHLCGDVYEKTHHLTISRKVGLTEEEIQAIIDGQGASLTPFDRMVISASDELFREQRITDVTWKALAESYDQPQLMEIVFLAGCYQTMAMLTKSFGMELEPDLEKFNALRAYR
jgi:4-carboxymuconolactone decarboxylase